jgi:phospholipid transport system substrate-binding protein
MKKALLFSCAVLGVSLLTPSAFAETTGHGLDPVPSSSGVQIVADTQPDAIGSGAEMFIDKMAQQGIGFLGDASMSDDQRKAEFKKLLNTNFDMNTIGRFALGRYWKSASDAQRSEYMELFKRMTINVYAQRFSDYKGQKLQVRGSRAEGESDILVNSAILQPSGPEVVVDWRVRKKGGAYKIVDVVVEGVSMAVTQRSDFASVIQRGGGDLNVLLAHLKSPK